MPKVINGRTGWHPLGWPPMTYIGRPSKWGNPFVIGQDGNREEVVQKYREWIVTQSHLMKSLEEIRGHNLRCWCAPLACHGDVLLELANG